MSIVKTGKGYKGMAMEGPVATWYSKLTLKDVSRHAGMAAQMAPKIPAGGKVLEIAPGPGYFCIELAKLGNYQITGLDISKTFVEIAQKNAQEAGVRAEFKLGDAANLPLESNTFDFLFCQAAFKNFTQPVQAIAEMYRVLRPGGMGVIVDLRRDASRADVEEEVTRMHLGWLNDWMTRWTFRNMLLKNAYRAAEMQAMVAQTPFGKCRIETSRIGFDVWLQK